MANLHEFFFQIYPYIAGSVFLLGSVLRFERGQYTWTSDSSELLRRGTLRFGSNLFHVGVLFLFLGHFIGLLMPEVFGMLGIGLQGHQLVAMISGGLFGFACLIELVMLIHRRVTEQRIRATTRVMDMVVLVWILITLSFGLGTLYFSAQELSGGNLTPLAQWAPSYRHVSRRRRFFRDRGAAGLSSSYGIRDDSVCSHPVQQTRTHLERICIGSLPLAALSGGAPWIAPAVRRSPRGEIRGEEMQDIIVIGAGIAGVPAAYELKRQLGSTARITSYQTGILKEMTCTRLRFSTG